MWLASISKRNHNGKGDVVPAFTWSSRLMREARTILLATLVGVGDETRERGFRMCTTMCVHRALSDAEVAQLGEAWCSLAPRDMAGGPLEILYERGCAATLSTRPCAAPEKVELGRGAAGVALFVPIDCGECPTCLDRLARAGGLLIARTET